MSSYSDFLVGWGSFSSEHKKPEGFRTFVLVDDYTLFDLKSKLTPHVLPRRDDRYTILTIWHNQAYGGEIYCKGGVVCPTVEQLPVVFCLEHGKPTGTYLLNATVETATCFVLDQI